MRGISILIDRKDFSVVYKNSRLCPDEKQVILCEGARLELLLSSLAAVFGDAQAQEETLGSPIIRDFNFTGEVFKDIIYPQFGGKVENM